MIDTAKSLSICESDAKSRRERKRRRSNNDRSHVPSACRTGCRALPQQPATDGHLFELALMYDLGAVSCGNLDARSYRYIDAITSTSSVTSKFWLAFCTLSRVKFSIDSAKWTISQLVPLRSYNYLFCRSNLSTAKESRNSVSRKLMPFTCLLLWMKMQNWFYLAKATRAHVVKH